MSIMTPPAPPPRRIWFAIFGAPLAWAVQSGLGWLLESTGCPPGYVAEWLSRPLLRGAEIIVALAGIAVAVAAFMVGRRAFRRSQEAGISRVHAASRNDYLAVIALAVSFVFILANVYAGLPSVMLPLCETMR